MRPCHTMKQTITNCRGRRPRRPAVTDKLPGTMCRERRLAVPRLLAICTAGEGTPPSAFPAEFGSCLSYRNQRADNIRPYGSFLDCCIVMVGRRGRRPIQAVCSGNKNGGTKKTGCQRQPLNYNYLFCIYASIAAAAFLPAPIARITVAAPVTASPPA